MGLFVRWCWGRQLVALGCAASGNAADEELDEIEGGGHGGHDDGEDLFEDETFGGNGRTCATCHPSEHGQSGTLSPRNVQDLFRRRPNDPLFRHDAADTVGGNTFDRIKTHATC